jgi:MerR family transcriptional regulator, copper efflux regulator
MQISEFSRAAGIPPDTVRFYVRRGLLQPETGMRGGSNPYQIFTTQHVEAARLIRLAQSLGFTLREIAAIATQLGAEGLTRKRKIELLRERLDELEQKAAHIKRMTTYLGAKVAWMEGGERGPEPTLDGSAPVLPACTVETAFVRAKPQASAIRRSAAARSARRAAR